MACEPKTFTKVDQKVFECLKGKLKGQGFNLEGTSGTLNGPMGIVIDFKWDEANATLLIEVTAKNFMIPCSKIYSEIEKAVSGCMV